ncbi:hypothetical protein HYDPIDRAFT_95105 [Hydnomerulius pinastri MD-312]|uniref:F-box domain-containing protein n=1 Tax=Hydnomerulius pinastri MD-312 TaxID=994086 RepID=A0A0C9W608_9AGAM|nr:hypothetical protein HYDPIDRAFT_95105 [Hydnomerulius pinastri MD-312]
MHQSLFIVEVQRAIFCEVYRTHRPTLAVLARTCRVFNSAALDVLWANLGSFARLIMCLPQDLWTVNPSNKKLVFLRPMVINDWEIFFKYSTRVRSVDGIGLHCIRGCSTLGDDAIFALSNPPTFGPLIPYLRMLDWDQPSTRYASLLRLLLTPSLVSLTLSTMGCALRSPEASIMTSIGTSCPSLRILRITSPTPFSNFLDDKGAKVLSTAILYLHSLRTLACHALDEAAVVHLARLPSLSDLSIELPSGFQLDKVLPHLAAPAFGTISSLTLNAVTLSTLTSFLEGMQFRPDEVTFTARDAPTVDALRLFFTALVNACDSEHLVSVSLSVHGDVRPASPSQQVTISTLQSLLALPNINWFTLDVPCTIGLDDTGITTLAKHWPKLFGISINAAAGWNTSSRITHLGLITLLKFCSELEDIAISVDFSSVDVEASELQDSRPGGGVTSDTCCTANFVTSRISHPASIAAFLSDICPRLHCARASWSQNEYMIVADGDEADMYRERWDEVGALLPAFTAVRRQCLRWSSEQETEEADAVPI